MRKVLSCGLLFWLLLSPIGRAEEIRYDTGSRRDPFFPLVDADGVIRKGISASGLLVEGIIFDPIEGSMALINGELYKEGDHVGGANVIRIFHDRVIFSQDDEEKTIWIREEIVEEKSKSELPKPPRTS